MTPFTRKCDAGFTSTNWIRVIEGVIISVVATASIGLLGYLWMIPAIKTEVQTINVNIGRIEKVTDNHEVRIRESEVKFAAHEARVSH